MAVNLGVNYLAVIVTTIAVLVLGFIWFRPNVFGNHWMAYQGKAGEEMKPGPDFRHRDRVRHRQLVGHGGALAQSRREDAC